MNKNQDISTYMIVIKISEHFFSKTNEIFPGNYKLIKLIQEKKKKI